MYNNPYYNYNPQMTADRIDSQIAELQKLKTQIPQLQNNQQPAINQTFQLAPNSQSGMKYVNSIEEVNKEMIFTDTPFFSKDLSVMWIKKTDGSVKSYEIKEIIKKDSKDLQIEFLMAQIEDLKEKVNAKPNYTNVDESIESKEPTNVSNGKSSKTKTK